ncbi:probable cytochrome P450 28d2 [Bombus flavifrons]|uniref:probable cytochrome P450 28d2 n=1 Tax=Bombus flavifrons TaxID=103934 RepID=UPI0037049343
MFQSQRCHAALGFMRKICTEEFELQGSDGLTYRAKPGAHIIIPIHALHNDPKYWRDPEVFDPERFNEERKQTIEKMTFLSFGKGPRICVGIKIAMLQTKACIASLLRNYRLELSPKTQVPPKISPKYLLFEVDGAVRVDISKVSRF